jgi:hypothetical protein
MSDYTVKMFHQDHNEILPKTITNQMINKSEKAGEQDNPENGSYYNELISLFITKYGKSRGTDYAVRFLSVLQFIEHYQKDLERDGQIVNKENSVQVEGTLLQILLDSFRPPQPPSVFPSSSLYNQNREFNYKKVTKALKREKMV